MSDFTNIQEQFMAHIRDPEHHEGIEGIENRRLNIYRELFFNNIKGFLSSGFPVLASIYSESQWQYLARTFFAQHQCRSPYFIDISKEFVEFLSNEYQPSDCDFPFLQELAHYEWLELDLSVRKFNIEEGVWDGASLPDTIRFSPLAQLVSYTFPVHQISPEFIPDQPLPEPVYLVVNRDEDNEVNFHQINPVTALLLDLIQQAEVIAFDCLTKQLQQHLPNIENTQLKVSAQGILEEMLSKQILLPGAANIGN